MRWAGGLGLAAACHSPPELSQADRTTYLQVVADRRVEPQSGLDSCATIRDPTLAGDCALHVATVESRRPEGRPARWCPELPEGVWRDECWFIAAEQANRAGRVAEAVSFCAQSGAFSDDCAQHLWQSEVRGLVHRRGSRAFSELLPAARQIHARWSPLLSEGTDFEARFWAKFFQNGFEGQGSFVDLAHCDLVPDPELATRCVEAGRQLYARELGPRLQHRGIDLCSLEPTEAGWSVDLLSWLPCRPDTRLDSVVAEQRSACD